jgi:hypothetical protein
MGNPLELSIREQVDVTCRRLLSELDRDPYSATFGCFDRRHWAWKLADTPEATFQRNAWPLAWWAKQTGDPVARAELWQAVEAALSYCTRVQHRDGAFDQAFAHEHSYGATAFLLHPLIAAYAALRSDGARSPNPAIEAMLDRAATFLVRGDERHGRISNHIAGAALSLHDAGRLFGAPRYVARSRQLLDRVLSWQSPEGWFVEYEGADPGYQTLCVDYLARMQRDVRDPRIEEALGRSTEFLSWFAHPDGTFAGAYGRRRTAILYPGGLAILGRESPLARALVAFALRAIRRRETVTLLDVDMGNVAPLIASYIDAIDHADTTGETRAATLPFERGEIARDFPEAGLYVRGGRRVYAVIGASNGGVIRVFDRQSGACRHADDGYAGELDDGRIITTQAGTSRVRTSVSPAAIAIDVPFHVLVREAMTPWRGLVLRALALTVMRVTFARELLKRILVRVLIGSARTVPLRLRRRVDLDSGEPVRLVDSIESKTGSRVRWLESGRRFVSIHMASSRYFERFRAESPTRIDVDELNARRSVTITIEL